MQLNTFVKTITVVFRQVVSLQGGLSSVGWSPIKVVFNQGGLSSGVV